MMGTQEGGEMMHQKAVIDINNYFKSHHEEMFLKILISTDANNWTASQSAMRSFFDNVVNIVITIIIIILAVG